MLQTDFVVYSRVVYESIKAAKLLNCRIDRRLASWPGMTDPR